MNDNNQLTFIDLISLISFVIALQNLELNISQDDLQKETSKLDEALRSQVEEIHRHLETQDRKIDEILKELKK